MAYLWRVYVKEFKNTKFSKIAPMQRLAYYCIHVFVIQQKIGESKK